METTDFSRRDFMALAAGTATLLATTGADSANAQDVVARPPAGFVPFSAPGRVVRVHKADCLQPNGLYPKPESAREMLTKAMTAFTGEATLAAAFGKILHKDDKVAIKPNGIAKNKFSSNKELIDVILEGVMAAGVPATSIVVFEQYAGFLAGTRVSETTVPPGVKVAIHAQKPEQMGTPDLPIPSGAGLIDTKFCKQLTDATAVINVPLLKDHAIWGYTGCMKNITHGCTPNPSHFHTPSAHPQIAQMYAHEAVRSRVRLHITDGYKLMYDQGPVKVVAWVPFESLYVSTDPVAMDTIGWEAVEKVRKEKGVKSLKDVGREPLYIASAASLGLGIGERDKIILDEYSL